MGSPVRPSTSIDQDLARIRAQHEAPAAAPIDSDLARIRAQASAPSSTPSPTGDIGDAINSGLDVLGLGKQLRGGAAFVSDLVQSHDLHHAGQAYTNQLASDKARLTSYEQAHPTRAMLGQGAGVLATLFADAPVRALSAAAKLPEAAEAVTDVAHGVGPALRRVGQAAKTGALTGGAVAGANADGSLQHRVGDALIGSVTGGLLAGGSRATGEATAGAKGLLRGLLTPAETVGEQAALGRMRGKLSADQMMPDDLLTQAMKAKETGTPAVVAHLAGPSMDNLSFVASTGPSAEAAGLRQSVRNAQRAEGDILNRGITKMSGVEDTPTNQAGVFRQRTEQARADEAHVNYPKAYAAPPVSDPEILDIIRNDPELTDALTEGVKIMRREQDVARLQGRPARDVKNPLTAPAGNTIQMTDQGRQLHEQFGTDLDVLLKRGLATQTMAEPPALPVQMLDYMKRGADVVIERGLKRGNLSAHDAGLLQQKVEAILSKVDRVSPEYAAARAGYAGRSHQIEAAEQGAKALSQSGPEITTARGALPSEDADQAYRTAATSALRESLSPKGLDSNLSKGFDNPFIHDQLHALYGEGTSKFDPYLEQGQRVNQVREAVAGNSKTAERQATQQEVLGRAAADATGAVTKPKRFLLNLPGKLADSRDAKVKAVMLQSLAKALNIAADSPELPELVEKLYNASAQPAQDATAATLRQKLQEIAQRATPRHVQHRQQSQNLATGVLAGLFGANQ